ncbi:hypothetical protein CR513_02724, partial [Mucuna pruriens]
MLSKDNTLPYCNYKCLKWGITVKKKIGDYSCNTSTKGPPAKRLFANSNDVKNLKWHANDRKCDGKL